MEVIGSKYVLICITYIDVSIAGFPICFYQEVIDLTCGRTILLDHFIIFIL